MKLALKIIIIICILGGGVGLQAQKVVATSGNDYKNTSGSISYTIGEPMISTYVGINNILTQGFHQTNLTVATLNELPTLNYKILAFPNPTTEMVNLKVENDNIERMQYQLYDMNGKLLYKKQLTENETEISFANLSNSTYFIKVFEGNKEVITFKIIKY